MLKKFNTTLVQAPGCSSWGGACPHAEPAIPLQSPPPPSATCKPACVFFSTPDFWNSAALLWWSCRRRICEPASARPPPCSARPCRTSYAWWTEFEHFTHQLVIVLIDELVTDWIRSWLDPLNHLIRPISHWCVKAEHPLQPNERASSGVRESKPMISAQAQAKHICVCLSFRCEPMMWPCSFSLANLTWINLDSTYDENQLSSLMNILLFLMWHVTMWRPCYIAYDME